MALELVTVGIVCADIMVRPVDTLPPRGALGLVPQLEMHMGGLAGVTAAVYARLGGSAAFIGRVGTDSFGDSLARALAEAGVDTGALRRDSVLRTAATVVLISENGERTFLHHPGATTSLAEADINLDAVAGARVLHWGGPGVTPGLDAEPMARVFARARALGMKTSLDTCYDGSGVWRPRLVPALPHTDIVFTSMEEAPHYTGCGTPEEVAAFMRDFGVSTVIIKLGPGGLYASQGDAVVRVGAHAVDVVDTTGAGDAACAGFLHGYIQNWPLSECARLANAVGALTVTRMGGAEGVRSLAEVQTFMESNPCAVSSCSA